MYFYQVRSNDGPVAKMVPSKESHVYIGLFQENILTFEPRHGISNNVVYATIKASDQPAHKRSLIRAFAKRLKNL